MPEIKVRFTGNRALARLTKGFTGQFPGEVKARLVAASSLVEKAAKENIKGSRARARRKGRPVTAKPRTLGVDTGRLRQSITSKVTTGARSPGRGIRVLRAEVGPQKVAYARIHEFGGVAGRGRKARIPARPYLGPAVEKTKSRVFAIMGRAFRIIR